MAQCKNCGSELAGSQRFCPSCGVPVAVSAEGDKPAASSSSPAQTKSIFRRVGLILFPILIVVGLVIIYNYIKPSVNSVIKQQPVIAAPMNYDSNFVTMTNVEFRQEGDDIVFSLDDVKRYRIVRFEYPAKNIVRPVMAYIDPQGRLVTAISISDHCGSTEFQIKNNQIYCAHCPSHWDMMTMEAYACCGNYFPDPIASRVAGNEVRIPKAEVEKWAGRL